MRRQCNTAKTFKEVAMVRHGSHRPVGNRYDQIDGILTSEVQNAGDERGRVLGRVAILKAAAAILGNRSRGKHPICRTHGNPMSASPKRPSKGQRSRTVTV